MSQSTLTAWKFETADGAETAAKTIQQLAKQKLVTVHDAATVRWDVGAKKPRTQQLSSLTGAGALGGAFWGMLFGLLFFVPLLGAAIGAATGALSGALADVGIDDGFINRVRDKITPGTSALFVLSSDAVVDRIRDAFAGQETPELVFTNLSTEQEAALREVFGEEQQTAKEAS
ncbi:DUF1269 domain-containing protein [Promicromonospora kroppenstedtii]|uniref:DUF1269 domain-containing protein n=1 Tax=Promicromonospora kroppenstedtii TaxID=440482 RepID=UPI0004BA7DC9|nr:DUF1269 domain-containing protein [Promicromonospora kroppenstedtii]